MKKIHQIGAALVIGALVHTAPVAFAQVAVTETSATESVGTVSEFSPDTVVVRTESGTEPLRYSYTKSTTVVDEAGNPVDISVVKSGVPVRVVYAREGSGMIARKIIVRKAVPAGGMIEKHETTTTTTESH